ncbi:unnamed protein product [Blepharisma stoltei]|uniref:Uncharacterized protein n=1 Tax=Blepharisma stoltei TaxID=1481888 RepID=A0AAU9JEI7_9CILI|nr:unnamed protein product [Blepharisma stoltei]
MGCALCKKQTNKVKLAPIIQQEVQEIEEVAYLPITALEEDLDLKSIVELNISCQNLPCDSSKKINPMVVFFTQNESGDWLEDTRTEIQKGNQNPAFISSVKVSYSFEKQMHFKLEVYDMKYPSDESLRSQILLGCSFFNIHEIVCSSEMAVTKDIENLSMKSKSMGTLTIRFEESSSKNFLVKMKWGMTSNIKGNICIRLSRASDKDFVPIYQSETLSSFLTKGVLAWHTIEMSMNKLCRGDESRPIRLELLRADLKKQEFLGLCIFTLAELKSTVNFQTFITNNEKVISQIMLKEFVFEERISFLDYVFGGCEISLIVGIDFTKSNGDPSASGTLHNLDSGDLNEYTHALKAVGDILQYYDSDKKIPVYGFGAKLPPNFDVISHCFALNGNFFDPEVNGVDGVLDSYKSAVASVKFHGPTIFNEITTIANDFAANANVSQKTQQYFILLILTDGIINDLESTIDEVVRGSELPLSIIIVGVGKEDFSAMQQLDADGEPLYSKKYQKRAIRDIVQFVPFSKFNDNPMTLAREVLFEVPNQFLSYMKMHDIKPNQPQVEESKYNKSYARTQTSKVLSSRSNNSSTSSLLEKMKSQFINDLSQIGYSRHNILEVIDKGISCMNAQLAGELITIAKSSKSVKKSALKKSSAASSPKGPNTNFENSPRCMLCHQNPIELYVKDCGHEIACLQCINLIGNKCPICSSRVTKCIQKFSN